MEENNRIAWGCDSYNQTALFETAVTLRTDDGGDCRPKVLVLEHHPNDSRLLVKDDDICQSLTSRMGTGGGNVPLVMITDE